MRSSTPSLHDVDFRHSGRELFYVAGDAVMQAPIAGGASIVAGTPAPLFRLRGHRAPGVSGSAPQSLIAGVTADNNRFLFRLGAEQDLPSRRFRIVDGLPNSSGKTRTCHSYR